MASTAASREWPWLVAWLALSLLAGVVGGLATASSVGDWYPTLDRPPWTPPNGVFGPVWTLLYLAMGTAAWLVWRRREAERVSGALWLFAGQLVLNAAWSLIFFGLRSPGAAAVEVALLVLAVAATLLAFRRISRTAGWLLAPYLAWVCFAAALNLSIWLRNGG
jgi:tryptophan-rich sensory protein